MGLIPCFTHNEHVTENTGDTGILSRRKLSYFYHLSQLHGKLKVCQTYFLNTLSISHQVVKTCVKKRDKSGKTIIKDQRGKAQCNTRFKLSNFECEESHKFPYSRMSLS